MSSIRSTISVAVVGLHSVMLAASCASNPSDGSTDTMVVSRCMENALKGVEGITRVRAGQTMQSTSVEYSFLDTASRIQTRILELDDVPDAEGFYSYYRGQLRDDDPLSDSDVFARLVMRCHAVGYDAVVAGGLHGEPPSLVRLTTDGKWLHDPTPPQPTR